MLGMTKILAVTLNGTPEGWRLTFRVEVPVNVFPLDLLLIRATSGPDVAPLRIQVSEFGVGTDGVVDVVGTTRSHTLEMALAFLTSHSRVSDLQVVTR